MYLKLLWTVDQFGLHIVLIQCCWLGPSIKVLLIDKVPWCKYYSCWFRDCIIHKHAVTNITGDVAKEVTTNDSGNRDSEQPRRYKHRYKKET